MEQERLYQVALTMIDGIGPVGAKHLISYCGSPEAVFKEKKSNLEKIPNIGPTLAKSVIQSDALNRADSELTFVTKNNVQITYFLEDSYPRRLIHFDESPILIYHKGRSTLNHPRTVAIVGTRKPTSYGLIQCERLVEGLKPYDVQIISGLAYGIDTSAHQASLQYGLPTIGIVGHGLDRIYPAQNRKMADRMLDDGAILSQFRSGTLPDRENFPMRNKLIAGMADVVVVVESKRKGGSIITAEFANEYNKDVFALPGKVNDEVSEGCNKLIKQHKANLLESVADISYIMRWEEMDAEKTVQASLFIDLDPIEIMVIEIIRDSKEISIDELSYKSQKSGSELAPILLGLEFKSMIKTLPGKKYILR